MTAYGVFWQGSGVNDGWVHGREHDNAPRRFTKEAAERYAREGNAWVKENAAGSGHYVTRELEE